MRITEGYFDDSGAVGRLTAAPAMPSVALPRTRPQQGALLLIGLLLGLALIAWLLSVGRMAGMDAGPGTDPGELGFYLTTWVVMMAAMMFPSIAPMVLAHAAVERGRATRGMEQSGATAAFVAGYLVCWTAFGLGAYLLLELGRALRLGILSWDRGGPYFAGAVIVVAAAYELTPLKDACLAKCRGPLDFVPGHWRDGLGGSLRMGVEHGAWCIGCCWALMAALFALGVMSVGWMAFVAALIAIEKLAPWKTAANRAIAVVLVVLGLAVAIVPERVPGLTAPTSASNEMTMQDGS
jgi:predicted metal-binding membrane protein